jgi:LPS sulfotransferase NodH
MWGTMKQVVGKLRAACRDPDGTDLEILQQDFGGTQFVHLQRGDVLAQAVSWAKAEQTGYWQDGDRAERGGAAKFDFDDVDSYVKTIGEHNRAWREWFDASAITPLPVLYEDLVTDMSDTLDSILHFLGLEVPPGHVVDPPTQRQGDGVNRQWTERYRSQGRLRP